MRRRPCRNRPRKTKDSRCRGIINYNNITSYCLYSHLSVKISEDIITGGGAIFGGPVRRSTDPWDFGPTDVAPYSKFQRGERGDNISTHDFYTLLRTSVRVHIFLCLSFSNFQKVLTTEQKFVLFSS